VNNNIIRSATFITALGVVIMLAGYTRSPAAAAFHEARVTEVNDGDTVTLTMNSKKYRTRLIGIDAPEMRQRPWGRRVKDHLVEIMDRSGWIVSVETDIVPRDKYDRLLVYLWTRDHVFINEQLVLDGYAVLFTIPPNSKYGERLGSAEDTAKRDKKGIWGLNGLKEKPAEYRKKHPRKTHRYDW